MSDADVIRRAAETLRKLAEQATPGPWVQMTDYGLLSQPKAIHRRAEPSEPGWYATFHGPLFPDPTPEDDAQCANDAAYAATMHPGVGRALADALQQHADDHLSGVGCWVQCGILAAARAILGEQS